MEYKYDAFAHRLEKSVDLDGDGPAGPAIVRYVVDGWNPAKGSPRGTENADLLFELAADGSLTTRYLRGDLVDELFARVDYGTTTANAYWYLTDHQGSIRDIVDASGVVVDSLTYDGFGNILSETNPALRGNYAYTSREWDAEIDLQYNRARYYDPTIGRWISQDPLGFDAGDSNLYRYVNNRPTGATDPSGLEEATSAGNQAGFLVRIIDGERLLHHLSREQQVAKGFEKAYQDILSTKERMLRIDPRAADSVYETSLRFLAQRIRSHYDPPAQALAKHLADFHRNQFETERSFGESRPEQAHLGADSAQFRRTDIKYADQAADRAYATRMAQLNNQIHLTPGERGDLDRHISPALLDFIPGVSAAKGIVESFRKGDYFDGVLYAALGAADIGLAVWVPGKVAKEVSSVSRIEKRLSSGRYILRALNESEIEAVLRGEGIIRGAGRTTPTQHIMGAVHPKNPWISATRSLETARFFATEGGTRAASPIILIDLRRLTSSILDVSTRELAERVLRHPRAIGFATAHQEILIFRELNPEAIRRIIQFAD